MISIYKPNSRNTGAAISFQASDEQPSLFVSIIKQHSWDERRKKGSFVENRDKKGKTIVIKFNQTETASIVNAIERRTSFSAFHSFGQGVSTQIRFEPTEEKEKGYVLKIKQVDNEDEKEQKSLFFISLSIGEARLIREYCIHFLHKSFSLSNPMSKKASNQKTKKVKEDENWDDENKGDNEGEEKDEKDEENGGDEEEKDDDEKKEQEEKAEGTEEGDNW